MINVILFVLLAVLAGVCAVAPTVYIKRKLGGNMKRVRDGVAVYVIFASLLNAVVYTVFAVGMEMLSVIEKTEWSSALINAALLSVCAFIGHIIWLKCIVKEQGETGDSLLYGAGYCAAYMVLSYVLSSVANAVISIMVAIDENAPISNVFISNITQVANTDAYTLFLEILQMLLTVIFEGAVCVILYRVLLCGNKKRWLAAAFFLHFSGNAVIRYHEIDRGYIILIYLLVAVIAAGAAYALLFPTKKKTEE